MSYARYLEKAALALWRVLSAVGSLGRARVWGYGANRERVELFFWARKAFLAGFLLALLLTYVAR